jgi:RNA polymerase sigma-70 factor (ECF subfamily)
MSRQDDGHEQWGEMQQDLVERARRGDRDAFGQLASLQVDRLHAVARLILHDPDLADDAVQEALVRCWRQLPKLREVDRFEGWLYRILVRAATDEIRRHRRFLASVPPFGSEPSVPDDSRLVADREALDRAFERLSLDHRAIVVLHHYAGLPLNEVAQTLGIPTGTAKSRHHYAMGALRAAIDADSRLMRPEEVSA